MSENKVSAPKVTREHTPGPWKIKRSGSIFGPDEDLVATTGYRVSVGSNEDDANAALIAQAPALLAQRDALLAACDGLLDAVRDCGYYDPGTMGQAVRDARAVIAQARGVAR